MNVQCQCWKPPRIVLAIATSMLNGCVTVGFKEGVPGTCPFVVA